LFTAALLELDAVLGVTAGVIAFLILCAQSSRAA
jgi:hypothetical protein